MRHKTKMVQFDALSPLGRRGVGGAMGDVFVKGIHESNPEGSSFDGDDQNHPQRLDPRTTCAAMTTGGIRILRVSRSPGSP